MHIKCLECTWYIVSQLSVSYCCNGENEAGDSNMTMTETRKWERENTKGPEEFCLGAQAGKSNKKKGTFTEYMCAQ